MLTIGIYPRKSVYRDNSDSVSVQVQLCKDYASIIFKDQEIDFRIYDRDEGFSGKNMNRQASGNDGGCGKRSSERCHGLQTGSYQS